MNREPTNGRGDLVNDESGEISHHKSDPIIVGDTVEPAQLATQFENIESEFYIPMFRCLSDGLLEQMLVYFAFRLLASAIPKIICAMFAIITAHLLRSRNSEALLVKTENFMCDTVIVFLMLICGLVFFGDFHSIFPLDLPFYATLFCFWVMQGVSSTTSEEISCHFGPGLSAFRLLAFTCLVLYNIQTGHSWDTTHLAFFGAAAGGFLCMFIAIASEIIATISNQHRTRATSDHDYTPHAEQTGQPACHVLTQTYISSSRQTCYYRLRRRCWTICRSSYLHFMVPEISIESIWGLERWSHLVFCSQENLWWLVC